jgi:hydroxyacylglutathione hydrolase
MQITLIPALSDNYIFLLHDPQQNIAAVVDPAEAEPVLERLAELKAHLVAIFNTHHHIDHIGGNAKLLQHFKQAKVYGGAEDRGEFTDNKYFCKKAIAFNLPTVRLKFYSFPDIPALTLPTTLNLNKSAKQANYSAATLYFAGGCGRLLEGTPAQMVDSLSKLLNFPDNTRVWCAHEYTLKNLQFALTVDSSNSDLKTRFAEVKAVRSRLEATVPSILGVEKRTNPFLRWDQPTLQSAVKSYEPVQTFARLRGMKDRF